MTKKVLTKWINFNIEHAVDREDGVDLEALLWIKSIVNGCAGNSNKAMDPKRLIKEMIGTPRKECECCGSLFEGRGDYCKKCRLDGLGVRS